MKNSIFVKFIAFALCAVSVAGIVLGGIGALGVESFDLNNTTPTQKAQMRLDSEALDLAIYHAKIYTREAYTNLPEEELSKLFHDNEIFYYYSNLDALEIRENGKLVHGINEPEPDSLKQTVVVASEYPVALTKTSTHLSGLGWPEVYDYSGEEVYPTEIPVTVPPATELPPTEAPVAEFSATEPLTTEPPVFPAAIPAPEEEGVLAAVITDTLNVRDIASPDGDLVDQLHYGDQVRIWEYETVDDAPWGRIDQGWINLNYVAAVDYVEELLTPAGLEELGEPLYYQDIRYQQEDYEISYHVAYYQGPELDVTVWLDEEYLQDEMQLVQILYVWRDYFIPVLLAGLIVFAMTFVFLCTAAGRTTSGEIRPSGLNRVPLDLYLIGSVSVCALCGFAIVYVIERGGFDTSFLYTVLGLGTLGIALAVLGFFFALAAQVKVKDHFWWRHSVCGWCVTQVMRFLKWLARGMGYLRRGIRGVFNLLPVIWQWLLSVFGIMLLTVLSFLGCIASYGFGAFFFLVLFILCLVGFVALISYGGYAFGTLLKGAKNMAQGNLNHKINTKYLYGCFKDFGIQLNNLAEGAKIAAERQMKSERMKTELITNVSHDIKTPLTSIINYVDLLKKPHSEAEEQQYLEVLDRQSLRLKKLIDDLMEMSKASTGNVTVELGPVNAAEAVNQALGEFADKLASVNLTPVFRHPEEPVTMVADGRLVWRVLSNILSNAVKYALPDTRLYIDLMVLQGNAVIAIKNISRDQLNVNADELMERFVRGDSSRNTEGSGLGLNIAKSLVELQHGQMHLMVDGDLFKVTLIFPCD